MKVKHEIGDKILLVGTIRKIEIVKTFDSKREVLYYIEECERPIREKDIIKIN